MNYVLVLVWGILLKTVVHTHTARLIIDGRQHIPKAEWRTPPGLSHCAQNAPPTGLYYLFSVCFLLLLLNPDLMQLGEARVTVHWGKPRLELKVGTGRQELKQRSRKNAVYWLFTHDLFSCIFFPNSEPPAKEWHCTWVPHTGLESSHINQERVLQNCLQATLWRHFINEIVINCDSIFSGNSRLSQVTKYQPGFSGKSYILGKWMTSIFLLLSSFYQKRTSAIC